jgi:hypothetical protein
MESTSSIEQNQFIPITSPARTVVKFWHQSQEKRMVNFTAFVVTTTQPQSVAAVDDPLKDVSYMPWPRPGILR